ncbi:hypothetical protein HIM_01431 [Hirsutella minnesotensis 3608]|nr:hypothetical protein HIM_01431 [Hirsutella minnesotensis 3608]
MFLFRTCMALLFALQTAVGLAASLPSAMALETRSGGSYVNMVYWPHWATKSLSEVNAKDMTHVMYAFGKVFPDGNVQLSDAVTDVGSVTQTPEVGGKWQDLFQFKKANPHVKTLFSIGGWPRDEEKTWFASAAGTPQSRERFVKTATQLMLDGGFDGIDIDWEFPVGETESQSHAELMKALRRELDELQKTHQGYHFLLTLATSASPWWHQHLSFSELIPILDFWYVMAYDYTGGWGQKVQHNANLFPSKTRTEGTEFNTDQGIRSLSDTHGIPRDKLVLGIPSYGHVYVNVNQTGDSMKSTDYVGARSFRDVDFENLDIDCDAEAVACLGYNKNTKELITLDTAATVAAKSEYVQKNGLAGMFMWDLNHDLPGEKALHVAAANSLGMLDRSPNLQYYPDSRYANVRGDAKSEPSSTTSSTTSSESASSISSTDSSSQTSSTVQTAESSPITTVPRSSSSQLLPTSAMMTSVSATSKPATLVTSTRAKTSSVDTAMTSAPSSASSRARQVTSMSLAAVDTKAGLPHTHGSAFPSMSKFWNNQTASTQPPSASLPGASADAGLAADLTSHLVSPGSNLPASASKSMSTAFPATPASGHGENRPTESSSQTGSASAVASANVACEICELPDYMIPAVNADGMVIKTVFATVIKDVTVACPNKAMCAAPSAVAVTQSVFVTVCPIDFMPAAQTVSVAPDAGDKPIPVTVAGHVVSMCVTELGCQPTDVPAPSAPGPARSGAPKVFKIGRLPPAGSRGTQAGQPAVPAQGGIQADADAGADGGADVGAAGSAGAADASDAAEESENECDSLEGDEKPGSSAESLGDEPAPVGSGSAPGAGGLRSSTLASGCTPESGDCDRAQPNSEAGQDTPVQAPPVAGHRTPAQSIPAAKQSISAQGAAGAQSSSGAGQNIAIPSKPKGDASSIAHHLGQSTATAAVRPLPINAASPVPVVTAGAAQAWISAWAVLAAVAVLI